MNRLDLSPLFRSTVGFDRLAHILDASLNEHTSPNGYPPYNIEVVQDNRYAITLALSGFTEDEIDIQVENKVLTIRGKKLEDDVNRKFLHKGIATRAFEHKFDLADHIEVIDAGLNNGLLTINLIKEIPDTMKPRKIQINDERQLDSNQVIEQKQQANMA